MENPTQLTYAGLWLAVFASQLCLPIPALLFLIVAGALCAEHRLHPSLVMAVGISGCLAGDGIWFWLGRRWGNRIMRTLCRLSTDPCGCSRNARRVFERWGLRILLVAKFVPGLDGMMPPLAGAEGASVENFLIFDTFGSALWSGAYVLLGFLFSNQLTAVLQRTERFGTLLVIILLVPLTGYAAWRGTILARMMMHLRLRRISASLLDRKLKDCEKIAVLDLLSFEDESDGRPGIPGSVRADPSRLRNGPNLHVPDDVEVVLYCTSAGEILSARVAVALKRRGLRKVWVLDGGLNAWKSSGLPLTNEMSDPYEVAERLGIKLPDRPITSSIEAT